MADCQTTGGCATLTTKIADDNSLEAQLRLGNSQKLAALDAEAKQLRAMLAESVSAARRNRQRESGTRRRER